MGSSQSKPEKHFSASKSLDEGLVRKLEDSSESNYSRKQQDELHIQKVVAKKLGELQKESSNILKEATGKLESKDTSSKDDKYSSSELAKRVDELKAQINARPKFGSFSPDAAKVRDSFLECIKEHKNKPLNCRKEFNDLNELLIALEGAP